MHESVSGEEVGLKTNSPSGQKSDSSVSQQESLLIYDNIALKHGQHHLKVNAV